MHISQIPYLIYLIGCGVLQRRYSPNEWLQVSDAQHLPPQFLDTTHNPQHSNPQSSTRSTHTHPHHHTPPLIIILNKSPTSPYAPHQPTIQPTTMSPPSHSHWPLTIALTLTTLTTLTTHAHALRLNPTATTHNPRITGPEHSWQYKPNVGTMTVALFFFDVGSALLLCVIYVRWRWRWRFGDGDGDGGELFD